MASDYKLLMLIMAKNLTEGADERTLPPPPSPIVAPVPSEYSKTDILFNVFCLGTSFQSVIDR